MAEQDLAQLYRSALEAFEQSDWDRFRQFQSPDVEYVNYGVGEAKGLDAYLEACQAWKRAFPDLKGNVRKLVSSEDTVMVEITWEGTNSGELAGPLGTLPATGKRIALPAAQVVTFRAGKTMSDHQYADLMTLMQQLGHAPAPATPAAVG